MVKAAKMQGRSVVRVKLGVFVNPKGDELSVHFIGKGKHGRVFWSFKKDGMITFVPGKGKIKDSSEGDDPVRKFEERLAKGGYTFLYRGW